MVVERIILETRQSPGDVLMATVLPRDLQLAYPGRFQIDVRTSADELFLHNPHITRLGDSDPTVRKIGLHYPLIHKSNRPYHFIHGYVQFLEELLGLRIPVTQFRGDLHLAEDEKKLPAHLAALGVEGPFWVLVAGGKYDFTAKWVNPSLWGAVTKHFENRITFVQCGEAGHWHPRIHGAIDLVGKTTIREFVRLTYHADGVACGVTFAMHLAAAVPARPGTAPLKPCVVVAGGREPTHWEAYPGHQFLSRVGMFPCCATAGCWKSRCQLVGDGDQKDRSELCERPIQVTPELRIAECIHSITAADVIRAIECYYEGGMLEYRNGTRAGTASRPAAQVPRRKPHGDAANGTGEGAGDTVQATGSIGNAVADVPQSAELGTRSAEQEEPFSIPTRGASEATEAVPDCDRPSELQDQRSLASVPRSALRAPSFDIPVTPDPNSQLQPPTSPLIAVLIIFPHGLGDAVQLTSLLLHLRHYHPEWVIDVVVSIGKHSAYRGLCRRVFIRDREPVDRAVYNHVFELGWHECHNSYANHPSTKAEQCLLDVFGLAPIPELCRYQIEVSPAVRAAAERYLESLCPMGPRDDGRWPVVPIHYQGNTSTDKKDLPHDLIRAVCDEVCAAGAVPVILDWDRRSPLPDGVRIHNPDTDHPLWAATGTGDAEVLAALIAASTLAVAIDSGPQKVAGATETRTLAVWTRHTPLHYFGLSANVLHLVPEGHEANIRGDRAVGAEYFAKHYHHVVYRDLAAELIHQVREHLPSPPDGLVYTRGFWVRRDNTAQDLVVVDDVALRDCYRIAEMRVPGPTMVDVGGHIGAASLAFHRRHPSAQILSVECCPENMPALSRNVGRFATVVQAALSYEPDVALLNAVYPNCASTGGSIVISKRDLAERLAAVARNSFRDPDAAPGTLASPATDPQSEIRDPQLNSPRLGEYWADTRPIRTLTLEALMAEQGLEWIDVLKLDCEGCELDLFENCQVLDRVGLIAGEFHGRDRFLGLVAERFADWKLEILRDGDPGTFWLTNPASAEPTRFAGTPTRSAEQGNRKATATDHDQVTTDNGQLAFTTHPQSVSLSVGGRTVEFTAHHVLRFTAGPDGSLIPTLTFRGREITQPWSLELATASVGNAGALRADGSVGNAVHGVPSARANGAAAPSPIQNPIPARRNKIQNRPPCRHLGAESGLRECATCRGNVRVKTFTCAHPAHVETTLAECGLCADYEAREQVTGVRG